MRQVNEAELIWRVKYELSRLYASDRNGLAAKTTVSRDMATQMIAERLVRSAFGRYEVLSDAPVPPDTDLFSAAAYRTGAGQSPAIEVDE